MNVLEGEVERRHHEYIEHVDSGGQGDMELGCDACEAHDGLLGFVLLRLPATIHADEHAEVADGMTMRQGFNRMPVDEYAMSSEAGFSYLVPARSLPTSSHLSGLRRSELNAMKN